MSCGNGTDWNDAGGVGSGWHGVPTPAGATLTLFLEELK